MKKYITLFIAVILAFSVILTACAPQTTQSSEESSTPESSASEPESSVSEPESSASEPESSASEPESSASEPEESSTPEESEPGLKPIEVNILDHLVVKEISDDHLILEYIDDSLYGSDNWVTLYVKMDFDTVGKDIIIGDDIYFKGILMPLEEPLSSSNIEEPVEYTLDKSAIEYFAFDLQKIKTSSTGTVYVEAVYDDFIIINYCNRFMKIYTENASEYCFDDLVSIVGDASKIEPEVIGDFSVGYEIKNATITMRKAPPTAKPVIYLYPEEEMKVEVSLELNGEFTCVYPEYNGSWKVTAQPDGTLTDALGREYYCLYWESNPYQPIVTNTDVGFIVKGEDTAEFLREKLLQIGLSEREANEFIIYWLPQMQHNNYNYIYFSIDEYIEYAKLTISPNPDTVIRFLMVWEGLVEARPVIEQELPETPERVGFTVVEWGGSEIK